MDSILKNKVKIVYDKWVTVKDKKQFLSNGVHPIIFNLIQEKVNHLHDINQAQGEVEKLITGQMFNFHHSNFYFYTSKIIDFVDIDMVNSDDSDVVYIYPLELRGGGPNKKMSFCYNGNNVDYYLHETFDEKTFELFKSGKIKILLNLAHDPSYPYTLNETADYFTGLGINSLNVIFATGTDCKEEYYSRPNAHKLVVSPAPLLLTHQVSLHMEEYPYKTDLGYVSELVTESDINSSILRKCKFLCLNRTMKPHRYVLAYHAVKNNLLKENYFSFLNSFSMDEEGIRNSLSRFYPKSEELSEYSKLIQNLLPHHVDTQGLEEQERAQMRWTNNKKDLYLNSYINIVSETSFENLKNPFISEKLWKPVINLQPLVVVGDYHTLKTIKDLGFKTFAPFIDETYDEILNPVLRMKAILNEIDRLSALPIEVIHDWYHSIIDILIYNRNHLSSMRALNPYQGVLEDIINIYKEK